MKKRNQVVGMLVGGMLLALALTGCGSDPSEADVHTVPSKTEQGASEQDAQAGEENKEEAPAATAETKGGYLFSFNGVDMGADMDADAIVEALGEPKSVFEEPSCAAQGTAYLYTYPGFEINTYPDGEKNYVAYIILKDDTVATLEGIDLSNTKEEVIAAYGDDYTEEGKMLSYAKDNMKLNFLFEGEDMVSIEYSSNILN